MKRKGSPRSLLLLMVLGLFISSYVEAGPEDYLAYMEARAYVYGRETGLDLEEDLTRAELVALLNRVFNYDRPGQLDSFKDLDSSAWYYGDIGLAVGAGLLKGYQGYIRPGEAVSRQEAYRILAQAYGLEAREKGLEPRDKDLIAPWALEGSQALYSLGYIGQTGYVQPRETLGRQEFFQLVYRLETQGLDQIESKDQLEELVHKGLLNFKEELEFRSSYSLDQLKELLIREKLVLRLIEEETDLDYGYNGFFLGRSGDIYRLNFFYSNYHIDSLDPVLLYKYRKTPGQMAYEKAWVHRRLDSLMPSLIKPSMSDLEKERAIHDYLVLRLEYDSEGHSPASRHNYTSYGALSRARAVCEGYAKLFSLMLDWAQIENIYVSGQAGGQAHAWNLVKIEGNWYHVDPTWNDLGGQEISYEYFNLRDEEISKSHSWASSYRSYPKAQGPSLD